LIASKSARTILVVIVMSALAAALSACRSPEPPAPGELRVSAVPDQSPEYVRRQHEALIDVVCGLARVQCKWQPARSYEELVAQIGRREVDVAFLGGVTFVQAEARHQAVPLAMRDIDYRFRSVVLVPDRDPARALSDLKGRRFAFGSRSSTSGHFMGRHLLRSSGIEAERDFASVVFSGSHDETMRLISTGQVDAGVVNASMYYRRVVDGDPIASSLRVLWHSPTYVDYVWAARGDLPAALRERLIDAFLDLDRTVPSHAEALARERAAGFVPAFATDFDEVRAVVHADGGL
jgi:phosphonate transport system substrate-binding protein